MLLALLNAAAACDVVVVKCGTVTAVRRKRSRAAACERSGMSPGPPAPRRVVVGAVRAAV